MRITLCLLVCCAACFAEPVRISRDGESLAVQADKYDAVVAKDGCLTNLRVAGQEFLSAGVSISRGSYFYQGGALKLEGAAPAGENAVTASSDLAEVRYEFLADAMKWTVKNKTDKQMLFFLVFDPLVKHAIDDDGAVIRLAAEVKLQAATFIRNKTALHISGATRLWGPWQQRHAIWETKLNAGDSREIEFKIVAFTDEHQRQIEASSKPAEEQKITVLSPLDYQVFQRETALQGRVRFAGRVKENCDKVEVRMEGTRETSPLPVDWIVARFDPVAKSFLAEVPTRAGGWYRAQIRATLDGKEVATASVARVGVGEVFVGAGQSNSTNSGGEGGLVTESQMVSTFSGTQWRLADDPQPGVHDSSMGGSFWPAFGDAMYEKYKVPIGVAVTGHGGTSINQWQKGDEFFQWTLGRVTQLGPGGFRALLWHQGETDVHMTRVEYENGLTNIIRDMKSAAGWDFPWIVAQVSYHNPDKPRFDSTRDAQAAIWKAGTAFEGPDTDTLTGDHRDVGGKGIHFSPKGLQAHGKLWAEKVGAYIDRALGR